MRTAWRGPTSPDGHPAVWAPRGEVGTQSRPPPPKGGWKNQDPSTGGGRGGGGSPGGAPAPRGEGRPPARPRAAPPPRGPGGRAPPRRPRPCHQRRTPRKRGGLRGWKSSPSTGRPDPDANSPNTAKGGFGRQRHRDRGRDRRRERPRADGLGLRPVRRQLRCPGTMAHACLAPAGWRSDRRRRRLADRRVEEEHESARRQRLRPPSAGYGSDGWKRSRGESLSAQAGGGPRPRGRVPPIDREPRSGCRTLNVGAP